MYYLSWWRSKPLPLHEYVNKDSVRVIFCEPILDLTDTLYRRNDGWRHVNLFLNNVFLRFHRYEITVWNAEKNDSWFHNNTSVVPNRLRLWVTYCMMNWISFKDHLDISIFSNCIFLCKTKEKSVREKRRIIYKDQLIKNIHFNKI